METEKVGSAAGLDKADMAQKILQAVLQGFTAGISPSPSKLFTMSPCLYPLFRERATKLDRVVYRQLSEACALLLDSSAFLPGRESQGRVFSAMHHAVVELLSNIQKHVCTAARDHRLRRHLSPTRQMAAKLKRIRDAATGFSVTETRHVPGWIGIPRKRNFCSGSKRRKGRGASLEKINILARRVCSLLYMLWIDPRFTQWRTASFSALARCCRAVYLIETGRRNLAIAGAVRSKAAEKLSKSGLPCGQTLFLEGELPVPHQM